MPRKVVLFELNEVPWRVVDDHAARTPDGPLARLLARSRQHVTVAADVGHLSPWVTWPTVHRGVPDERHLIGDLGQDRTAVDATYPPVWRLARDHGLDVGVCGSLHSSPAPGDLGDFAFYLPDAFAGDDRAHPPALSRFQAFNLAMTRSSARNVDAGVSWGRATRLLVASRELGIRATTYRAVAAQLADERRRPQRRTRRRTFQAVLAFDVFMAQLERTRPHLSTFFSNHVASAMHRYWAASYPDDYDRLDLDAAWRSDFGDEVPWAMSQAERMLARLAAFADAHPEHVVWVASSMGQEATLAKPLETAVYVVDLARFARRLGLPDGGWEQRPAMLPQTNLCVRAELADAFEGRLARLALVDQPVRFRRGEAGFFSLELGHPNMHGRPTPVRYDGRRLPLSDFGMQAVEIEDRSGTTAYHVPEGVLAVYDPQVRVRPSGGGRPQVSTLELAPALLRTIGVPVPGYMVPVSPGLTV